MELNAGNAYISEYRIIYNCANATIMPIVTNDKYNLIGFFVYIIGGRAENDPNKRQPFNIIEDNLNDIVKFNGTDEIIKNKTDEFLKRPPLKNILQKIGLIGITGPQGPKGDKLTFDDLSVEDKRELMLRVDDLEPNEMNRLLTQIEEGIMEVSTKEILDRDITLLIQSLRQNLNDLQLTPFLDTYQNGLVNSIKDKIDQIQYITLSIHSKEVLYRYMQENFEDLRGS